MDVILLIYSGGVEMNFAALKGITRDQSSTWEEKTQTKRKQYTIAGNRGREILRWLLLGISAILLGGLVTSAGAQTNSSATYYLKRGVDRYNARDFELAIADFSLAIQINSDFTRAAIGKRHRANYRDNRMAGIASDDRIVVSDPFNALAYCNRGITWHAKGDASQAIEDLNKAIAINPRYVDAYIARGRAWHSKGDLARAIADYNRAMVLDPRCAFAYNNRGIARKETQDLAGAISDFDRAIVLDPGLVQAYVNRGAARFVVGDLAGAIADLDYAIASEPRNPTGYNNRGAARGAAGDFTGALADYDQAILLDPGNALAHVNRGLTRLQEGNISGAETDFKRALALDPGLKPGIEQFLRRDDEH